MSPETSTTLPKNQKLYAIIILLILMGGTLYAAIISIEPPNPKDELEGEGEFYIKIGENVAVTSIPEPNNEPAIAVDPNNPLHIVAAGNDYGTINDDAWVGYYVSWDGGENWTRDLIPGYVGGPISQLTGYRSAGDPVVRFDAEGNVYISGICFKRPINPYNPIGFGWNVGRDDGVFVAKSTDGGRTFDQVRIIVSALSSQVSFHDKEWMAVDMNNGNVYIMWAVFTVFNWVNILFSRSTDGGNTWSVPQVISDYPTLEFGGQGSTIQVTPDGTVHCFWIDFQEMAVRYTYSTDYGQSFSAAESIADVVDCYNDGEYLDNGDYRVPTLLMSAVDLSDTNTSGSLYVTWNDYDNDDADILLIYSRDNGQTWSEPVRVNNDTLKNGKDQFFPAVAVSYQGYVHLVFYDRRNDDNNTLIWAYYAVSRNGGENFTINMNISDVPFDGDNAPHPFIGDYLGIAATNNTADAIWCDTREGTPNQGSTELYFSRIRFGYGDECGDVCEI